LRQNPFKGAGYSLTEEPPKNEEKTIVTPKCTAKSRIWEQKPEPIATKFCLPGAVQNVITPANFGEDRLRGVAGGRILAFSIDFFVAFKTLSHYRARV